MACRGRNAASLALDRLPTERQFVLRQGDEPVPGYHLLRRLGRGSFGEVWSATGPGGTPAALKFINVGDQQGLSEFQAIQRIKQIRHAHLMPIIGIWLIDEQGR